MNLDLRELGYSQMPHYCTHAVEYLDHIAREMPAQLGIPADFEVLLTTLIRDSVKFLLPDNGYLFADHDFKPAMFDLIKLPYPVCALEFTATDELYAAGSGLAQSAKRIALCFDPWQLPPAQITRLSNLCLKPFLADVPAKCLAVMAVYEAQGSWGAAVGVVLIDLEHDKPKPLQGSGAEGLGSLATKVGERLNQKGSAHGLPATFITFPARSMLVGQSPDEALEALYIDTIDEMRVSYEFLAALNCSNVGTQEVAAPKALNARRVKKGKPLFFPYKLLDLAVSSGGPGSSAGGTHASPRTHLRRGHLRHLGEARGSKVLWINATMVNTKAGQPVSQVYKVKPPIGL